MRISKALVQEPVMYLPSPDHKIKIVIDGRNGGENGHNGSFRQIMQTRIHLEDYSELWYL
jgi:hypothetical protein